MRLRFGCYNAVMAASTADLWEALKWMDDQWRWYTPGDEGEAEEEYEGIRDEINHRLDLEEMAADQPQEEQDIMPSISAIPTPGGPNDKPAGEESETEFRVGDLVDIRGVIIRINDDKNFSILIRDGDGEEFDGVNIEMNVAALKLVAHQFKVGAIVNAPPGGGPDPYYNPVKVLAQAEEWLLVERPGRNDEPYVVRASDVAFIAESWKAATAKRYTDKMGFKI